MITVPETWGPVLKEGVQKQELTVIPFELQLEYDYWNYRMSTPTLSSLLFSRSDLRIGDIMVSVLPEELHDGIPTGFNIAGHVGTSDPGSSPVLYPCRNDPDGKDPSTSQPPGKLYPLQAPRRRDHPRQEPPNQDRD